MLGIGFWELIVVCTIGLVVVGPKRLPEAARFAGHFFNRIHRQISSVKADIRREIALEDMKKIHNEYKQATNSVQQTLSEEMNSIKDSVEQVSKDSSTTSDK